MFFSGLVWADVPRLAILGDSALGVAAHPDLQLYSPSLLDVLRGTKRLEPSILAQPRGLGIPARSLQVPRTLWPTNREYHGERSWVFGHMRKAFNNHYLNTPEYSWPALLGSDLGLVGEQILVAAEEEARAQDMRRQVDRLLNFSEVLPPIVVVYFTVYDLCAPSIAQMTPSKSYGDSIVRGVKYMLRNGKIPPEGLSIVFPHFLKLAQLIASSDILSRPVQLYGETTTCKEARRRSFQPLSPEKLSAVPLETLYLSSFFPPNPVNTCPSLFAQELLARREVGFFSQFSDTKKAKEIRMYRDNFLAAVADRVRNYRRELDQAILGLSQWLASSEHRHKVRLITAKETALLDFSGSEIADDCFHFNVDGQLKIKQAIRRAMVDGGLISASKKALPCEQKKAESPCL